MIDYQKIKRCLRGRRRARAGTSYDFQCIRDRIDSETDAPMYEVCSKQKKNEIFFLISRAYGVSDSKIFFYYYDGTHDPEVR